MRLLRSRSLSPFAWGSGSCIFLYFEKYSICIYYLLFRYIKRYRICGRQIFLGQLPHAVAPSSSNMKKPRRVVDGIIFAPLSLCSSSYNAYLSLTAVQISSWSPVFNPLYVSLHLEWWGGLGSFLKTWCSYQLLCHCYDRCLIGAVTEEEGFLLTTFEGAAHQGRHGSTGRNQLLALHPQSETRGK